MVAAVAELGEQQRLGRLARAGGDGADAALEARDPLLERRHRRVAEARVDVPVLLQREQVGRVLGVLEHERGRLIDRHRAGTRRRVGAGAGVDRARAHPPVAVLGVAHPAHDGTQVRGRTFLGTRCIRHEDGEETSASRHSRETGKLSDRARTWSLKRRLYAGIASARIRITGGGVHAATDMASDDDGDGEARRSAAAPASAHRFPGTCTVNGIDLTSTRTTVVRRRHADLPPRVQNTKQLFGKPCDVSGSNLGFRLPTRHRRATSPTAPAVPRQRDLSRQVCPAQIGLGPPGSYTSHQPGRRVRSRTGGVAGVPARHRCRHDFAEIVKTLGSDLITPSLTIDKSARSPAGRRRRTSRTRTW